MFVARCDRCGTDVLLGAEAVRTIENTAGGIVVSYECVCGELGSTVTGRRAS